MRVAILAHLENCAEQQRGAGTAKAENNRMVRGRLARKRRLQGRNE
jgi:hypothetical protein